MTSTGSSRNTGGRSLTISDSATPSHPPPPASPSPSTPAVALLVPSRGRPDKLARLYQACLETCTTDWYMLVGLDEDDSWLQAYIEPFEYWSRAGYWLNPRMGLASWTNELVSLASPEWRYLVSIGDDMVPVARGWDQMLVDEMPPGGGFTYPEDGRRNDIPECVMTTSEIVRALGWMAEPFLNHWYIDNVWRDLGTLTDSLRYVPWARVEHRHPNVKGGDKPDGTYTDAAKSYDTDLASYQRWRLKRMHADAATVRRVREAHTSPERHTGPPA